MTDEVKNETPAEEPTAEELEEFLDEAEKSTRSKPANEGEESEKESKKTRRRTDAELADLKQRLSEAEAKLAEENDKYLRLAAEYDNFRRRTAKEREGIYADAFADALTSIFPVVDNLERAAQYADGESVAKGVSMVLRSIAETFERLGVTEIPTEQFDPNLHNAVFHVEDDAYGESAIVEVLQKGYRRGDKVLRYAMVKVAN